MNQPNGRIEKGQSVTSAVSARTWNRFCETADQVLGDQYGQEGSALGVTSFASNVVLIRNDSGFNLPQFGVLGISGVAIDPTAGTEFASQFARKPILTGVTPTTSNHSERFVVAVEPILSGQIGRAAASGVFACRVNVTNADHDFADVRNNDRTQLASADCGVCQLLWKQSGTGANKWALGCM